LLRNRALKFKADAKQLSSDARIIKDFCEPIEHTSLRRRVFIAPVSSKGFCAVSMPNKYRG